MDHADLYKNLKEKKKQLVSEQQALIKILREQYSTLYENLIAKDIDLNNLKAYSANLTAALIVSINLGTFDDAAVINKPQQEQMEIKVIQKEELMGLTDEQKAALVKTRYGALINEIAEKYNLDPKILFATIMVESGGDTYAYRGEPSIGDASYGLGQILYGTAVLIGHDGTQEELYDPRTNIELMARYHRLNLDTYGEMSPVELAGVYNSGSPYSSPIYGHTDKFGKWYMKATQLGV